MVIPTLLSVSALVDNIQALSCSIPVMSALYHAAASHRNDAREALVSFSEYCCELETTLRELDPGLAEHVRPNRDEYVSHIIHRCTSAYDSCSIVIAVLGVTGAGKSNFISALTSSKRGPTSSRQQHSSDSQVRCTVLRSELLCKSKELADRPVILLDCPGCRSMFPMYALTNR